MRDVPNSNVPRNGTEAGARDQNQRSNTPTVQLIGTTVGSGNSF